MPTLSCAVPPVLSGDSRLVGSSVDWDLIAGPYSGSGGYRLEMVATGTRFTLDADLIPTGFFKIGRRQNQKDVGRLKSLLEQGAND